MNANMKYVVISFSPIKPFSKNPENCTVLYSTEYCV